MGRDIPTPDEYREMVKDAFDKEPEDVTQKTEEERFLERVLGPELKAWLDRGYRYGYGTYDDSDCEED